MLPTRAIGNISALPEFRKVSPKSGHNVNHIMILVGQWRVFEQLLAHGEQILQLVRVRYSIALRVITEYRAEGCASVVRKIVIIKRRGLIDDEVFHRYVRTVIKPRVAVHLFINIQIIVLYRLRVLTLLRRVERKIILQRVL